MDGWKSCELRNKINGDIYNSLAQKVGNNLIKQVYKSYELHENNKILIDISKDYLWNLTLSELYAEGGYEDGKQYKYYSTCNLKFGVDNSNLNKRKLSYWWLRTGNNAIIVVGYNGYCKSKPATYDYSEGPLDCCPGFAI